MGYRGHARGADGGGPKGAGTQKSVFDFIYPLSRLRLFMRLLTPAGSEWAHEAFLGSIWETLVAGEQNAHPVLLFTRHPAHAFFIIIRFAASVKFTEG